MSERIAWKNKDAAAAMWIGTFHAFGLDIIRRFHKELGLIKDPRMLDRTEAVELLERKFPRLGLVHYQDIYDPTDTIAEILNAISRAKDEVVDEKGYGELARSMIEKALTLALNPSAILPTKSPAHDRNLDACRPRLTAKTLWGWETSRRQPWAKHLNRVLAFLGIALEMVPAM